MSLTFPIAYIAGTFPLPSETFVYREVRGLRARGWAILPVSLHAPPPANSDADLRQNRLILYSSAARRTLAAAVAELFSHPVQSLKTLAVAFSDAARPGELISFPDRLKFPFQALAALGLARRLRRAGIRHIHCHFAHAPTTLGMYAAIQLNIPFSFTGHANDLFQRRALLKTKLRRAAFVACISQWHRQWYSSICPDPSAKYEVIRCGVDVSAWQPAVIAPVPVEKTTLKILTLCRLVEKKGVDTLIAAAAELNRRGISAELTIVGDGPDRARLQTVAAQLHCGDWLHWLGAVDNSLVPSLLSNADIFALPCRDDARGDRDGIPVVLIEAMACGVPVVGGDLPAIRELVEDGASGLLVQANNPASLADKLTMLWHDPDLRRRLADAGRQRVLQEFSMSMNLDRLERRFIAAQHA